MRIKEIDIVNCLHRFTFLAALMAMVFQTTIQIYNFSLDTTHDYLSMDLIEDVGEKELEEEKDVEKVEWQNEFLDMEQIVVFERTRVPKTIPIILAFSPETHSPPPKLNL